MKTEKIFKITSYICDNCKKRATKNLRVSVGELDFCSKVCFDNYQKQNSLPFKQKK